YSFMFPRDPGDNSPGPAIGKTAALPLEEGPCPSCTALLDQLDGAAEHARQHINFVVVAKTSLPRLLTFAEERGWRRLRLFSWRLDSPQLPPSWKQAPRPIRPGLAPRQCRGLAGTQIRPTATVRSSAGPTCIGAIVWSRSSSVSTVRPAGERDRRRDGWCP